MREYTKVLTIAGSDSGGGAGIQADLKTFGACGCYGMSCITAITAQNTQGVRAIHPVPVAMLRAQLEAVFDDIGVDAVKVGMLYSAQVISCVAGILERYGCSKVVIDPVMVATSGDRLLEEEALDAMKMQLFPLAGLITPNIPEAELLGGCRIEDDETMAATCSLLAREYRTGVLLKAGHRGGEVLSDLLLTGPEATLSTHSFARHDTPNTHGTGCTLSAAIAAYWGRGLGLASAVAEAEDYLHRAIAAGSEYRIGTGHGPVHHFHAFWR